MKLNFKSGLLYKLWSAFGAIVFALFSLSIFGIAGSELLGEIFVFGYFFGIFCFIVTGVAFVNKMYKAFIERKTSEALLVEQKIEKPTLER